MHADTATRQHWMSVLAHSQPAELAARLNALNITADYEVIRAAETGLVQIQARMGGTGERFFFFCRRRHADPRRRAPD